MMGYHQQPQSKLFYIGIDLDRRIRNNHPLRKISKVVDFDFIYSEVKESYGSNGNISVPPPVILKLLLLLIFYNVRSERELMETVPERIDWLWFLGYDMDTEISDHSVLSKACKRWGAETFKVFFERIVWQCVEAGLVDGSKIFIDSSLVEADASNKSVVDTHSLKRHLNKSYKELEERLEDQEVCVSEEMESRGEVNKRYISTTDPDAAIIRQGAGKAKLSYKTHRAVDHCHEIITATEVTAGDVNEAHRMTTLMDAHQSNTLHKAETVVADSKYGTIAGIIAGIGDTSHIFIIENMGSVPHIPFSYSLIHMGSVPHIPLFPYSLTHIPSYSSHIPLIPLDLVPINHIQDVQRFEF